MADPGVADAVARSLAALPEPYRTAVRLRYLDGVVTAQAAAYMGLSRQRFDHVAVYGLTVLRRRAQGRARWCLVRSETGGSADPATLDLVRRAEHLWDRLTPVQRAAVRLRYLDRLTLAAAAARLGISREAVNMRSRNGVAKLRELAAAGTAVAA